MEAETDSEQFGKKASKILFRPNSWNEDYFIGLSFDKELYDLFYGIYYHKKDAPKVLIEELKKAFPQNESNETWPLGLYIYEKGKIDYDLLVSEIESGDLLRKITTRFNEVINKTKNITQFQNK